MTRFLSFRFQYLPNIYGDISGPDGPRNLISSPVSALKRSGSSNRSVQLSEGTKEYVIP